MRFIHLSTLSRQARSPLGRAVAVVLPGLLLGLGLVAAIGNPASAATSCSASYSTQSQWGGGFVASINVSNTGASAITGWTVTFTFGGDQKVTNSWNTTVSQSGENVTAANVSYNGSLGAGASTSLGFQGTWTSSDAPPSSLSCAPAGSPPPTSPPPTTPPPGSAPQLHVSGNHIVTASGATYRLLGVDRSSGEYACVQGKAMWDGGPVDQASVDAMKSWNIHAVRLPLNEECWLGTYGSPSGSAYQQAVVSYVNLLVANGITPILDLHWTYGLYTGPGSGCSDVHATCQKPMPDAQYAPKFWASVATTFKGNNAVVFDLFNEPYPDAAAGYVIDPEWTCWRDGGTCPGIDYQVAGMQSLIDAVRGTGATNVVMAGGIAWSNDLSHWLQYKPTDPTGNLVAAWHSYNFNACSNTSCWDSQVAPVAAQVPVDAGEIGQNSCAHDYIDQVMAWADSHGIGYQAWTWNPWGCSSGSVLIQDDSGTPTSTYGEGFKAHLLTQNP